jgi:hypothetical protein
MPYHGCKMPYHGCKMPYHGCKMLYIGCKMPYHGCKMLYIECKMLYIGCKMPYPKLVRVSKLVPIIKRVSKLDKIKIMSRKYKFQDQDRLYFVSFAVVYWIDALTRKLYKDIIIDSLRYCQQAKGLELYAYCLMTNHVHLIIGSQDRKCKIRSGI